MGEREGEVRERDVGSEAGNTGWKQEKRGSRVGGWVDARSTRGGIGEVVHGRASANGDAPPFPKRKTASQSFDSTPFLTSDQKLVSPVRRSLGQGGDTLVATVMASCDLKLSMCLG